MSAFQVWVTVAFFALCGVLWFLSHIRVRRTPPAAKLEDKVGAWLPTPEPPAQAPPPPPPAVETPKRDIITIVLVSAHNRPLGRITMERRARRNTLQHRLRNGQLANFVCSSFSDSRTFIYRRVSNDREGE